MANYFLHGWTLTSKKDLLIQIITGKNSGNRLLNTPFFHTFFGCQWCKESLFSADFLTVDGF